MEVNGQLHDPAALPPEKRTPGTNWIGGCVGPRIYLEAVAKEKFLALAGSRIPIAPFVQPVA
jgi:hypothetical protein